MRCYLISCRDYKVVREVVVSSFSELIALCLAEEQKANDGYCVFAQHNSQIVADAEGLSEHWEPDPIYQGQLAYACGYHD